MALKDFFLGGVWFKALPVTVVSDEGVSSTEKVRTFSCEFAIGGTAYAAGDVIDVSKAIANVAKVAGAGITIIGARMQTDEATALAGKNMRFHVYNNIPTNIPADNAPMTIDYANVAKREGTINLAFGTGNMSTVGGDNYTNLNLNPNATSIHVVAENVDGTPSVTGKKITLFLKVIQGN